MSRLPGSVGVAPLGEGADEQPVDVPRLVAAVRRAWWLIALIVVPLTLAVLVLSLVLPKTYDATARLVLEDEGTALDGGAEAVTRRLATVQTLVTSREVLARAAQDLRGETPETLEDKVSASVDDTASIIDVSASDGDPRGAAEIANEVTLTFVELRRGQQRRRFAQARRDLQAALDRLGDTPDAAVEIAAIRQRQSELSVAEVAADDELQLAEAARPPEEAASPLPLQNTLLAFFAALFLAVLAVLGREAVAPRVSGPRELSRLTGLVPLVVVPPSRRRRPRHAAEAYETIAASLRLQAMETPRIIVVTSAHRGEGRSTVAEGVARALANGGVPTLLVAADLRRPKLHERLAVPEAPGLAEVLSALEHSRGDATEVIKAAVHAPHADAGGHLRVLPSGNPAQHPAAVLSGAGLGVLFDAVARSRYRFVIVEGAPLMGPIDGQLLARGADAVLVVCRLDRLSPSEAAELGELLERIDTPALGAVVIGGAAASYSLGATAPPRAGAPVPSR